MEITITEVFIIQVRVNCLQSFPVDQLLLLHPLRQASLALHDLHQLLANLSLQEDHVDRLDLSLQVHHARPT